MRASQFLTKEEQASVEAAVAEAERTTTGEIVVVIASRSGRYHRAADIFGFLTGLVGLAVAYTQAAALRPLVGEVAAPGLLQSSLVLIFGFVLGSSLASRYPRLRLPFVPPDEMTDEVRRRAAEVFYRYRVGKTVGGTGILIYVSLFERTVYVLGDDPISEQLQQTDWNEVRDQILRGIGDRRRADGLRAGVLKCGELLTRHFPLQGEDVNELPNEVHLID